MPTKKTARFPRAHGCCAMRISSGLQAGTAAFFGVHDGILLGEAGGWPDKMQTKTRRGARATRAAVGFTVGRVLGGAVQRNRIKRRLREAVRMTLPARGLRRIGDQSEEQPAGPTFAVVTK